MKYKRKTKDEFILLGDYGYGWEEILSEDNFKDIKLRLKEYKLNDFHAKAFKVQKKRIRL